MPALIVTDLQQRIAHINGAAERLFATTSSTLCGQPLSFLFPQLEGVPPEEAPPVEQRLLLGQRQDGTTIAVSAEIARVAVAGGVLVTIQIPQTHPDHLPAGVLSAGPSAQQALLCAVQDAVIVTDSVLRILDWNPAAETLYGWSAAEVLGKPIREVLATQYEDTDELQVREQFLAQGVWKGEAIQRHRAGHLLTIQSTVAQVRSLAGEVLGLIAINRDISARRRAEAELRAHAGRLELLTEISRAFTEVGLDQVALLNQVAWQAAETLCDLCLIHLSSGEPPTLTLTAMHYYDTEHQEQQALVRELVTNPPLRPGEVDLNVQVFERGQPLLMSTIDLPALTARLQPDAQAIVEALSLRSLVAVPLRAHGYPIGVLSLYRSRPHWQGFTEDDLRLTQDIADRAALTIENARLYAQTQRELTEREQTQILLRLQARRLEILSEASRTFAEPGLRYEHLATRIVDHLAEQLSCVCALHQCSDDGRWLVPVALRDQNPEALAEINQLPAVACEDPHPLAQVFRSAQPLLVPVVDVEQLRSQLAPEYRPALERFPVRTLLMVPVQGLGQSIGVLTLLRRQRDEPSFTTQDLHLAQDLADRVALAIANAHLLQQAERELAERERAERALAAERAELARRVEERTADLSLANAELARAMRLKDEFLATMSHELRTPLNSILGRAQALQEAIYGPVTPEQVRALRAVEESGQHLLELINDILDLSKIETGKLVLERSEVDVDMLCAMCLRMVKEAAVVKRITLTTTLDGQVELLQADERRLRQILVNLLSNAVKFTPEGGKVGLEVRADAQQGTVTFTVWDTGIGIAAEDLPKLFRPFVQLDSSLNRQYTGTGLGLALVLRLAKAHGGSVAVESTLGQGSRFQVTMPWSPVEQATEAGAPTMSESALPPLRRALVIEDSTSSAALLMGDLVRLGVQAQAYPQVAGALKRASEMRPDLILLDLLLPDGDGWEVLRQLKAEPRTRQIPVLVVSVVDEPARAREGGALGLLLKPLDRTALRQVLGQHFALGGAGAESEQMLQEYETAQVRLRLLLAEDNEANIAAVSDYLAVKGYEVLVVRNGSEAVAQAQRERPDLILMDIQMPGMDGLEATRQIRADPALAHIPIIALTALAMPGDRERCLVAGASEYLTKPVHLRTLLATIAAHSPTPLDDRASPIE